jgi:uncharacterized protein YvpB
MRRPLPLILALLMVLWATPESHAGDWELSERAWRRGQHQGTQLEKGALTLSQGAAVGTWTLALPADVGSFDRVLTSLGSEAAWPSRCQVRVEVRVRVKEGWTLWFPLGDYGGRPSLPRSRPSADSRGVKLEPDLLVCSQPGHAVEVRLGLQRGVSAPRVRRLVLDLWTRTKPPEPPRLRHAAWGRVLDVPQRSQRQAAPKIAHRVCSPTSLGMVLSYHGVRCTTDEVARAVHDRGADLFGNWSFNVAYAAERGLIATARHLKSFAALEREIAAGCPVVISHRYSSGQLTGGAVSATSGHLIVVVGFTKQGDVVVNDPAGRPARGRAIRRVYRRSQIWRSWQRNHEGVAYLLRPR